MCSNSWLELLLTLNITIVEDVNNANNECKHEKDVWNSDYVNVCCRQVSRDRSTDFYYGKDVMGWKLPDIIRFLFSKKNLN